MGSSFVQAVESQAALHSEAVAFRNSRGEFITYAELKRRSDALARKLAANASVPAGAPLVVYGHKSPLMLVAFFACVKSGHAYVPVDVVYPTERVASIIGQLGETAAIDTTGESADILGGGSLCPLLGIESFEDVGQEAGPTSGGALGMDDTFYILFTSGSTGTPKGVEVTTECVDGFYRWLSTCEYSVPVEPVGASSSSPAPVGRMRAAHQPGCNVPPAVAGELELAPTDPVGELEPPDAGSTGEAAGLGITPADLAGADADRERRIWFNRSPFTFDVSLTDMVAGLSVGDELFALEDEAEKSLALAFESFSGSGITDWVSTPSFVEQCLADEKFDACLLPGLRRMLLAGEVLRPETVRLAQRRFPGLRVFNGYGPTESTDLVTLCEILPDMLAADRALPIGYAKPGSRLLVLDPETREVLPDGSHGELFVAGDTVAKGYWRRADLTRAAFGTCPEPLADGMRSYRTGDEVTREADGLYYYHGRYDLQIKLHGYRIELGDIESTLCALPEVHMACVLPVVRDGSISHLVAIVVPADLQAPRGFELTKRLKRAAREAIPSYMIPRAFKYVDSFPLNPSGKADRKALAALLDS